MKVKYIETYTELEAYVTKWIELTYKLAGLDTETTGLDPHRAKVRLIQLSILDTVYVIDCFKIGHKAVAELFNFYLQTRKDVTFAGHNLKFDVQMLWSMDIDLSKSKLFDTMLAAQCIEGGLPYQFGLKFVMERFMDENIDKTEQLSDWSLNDLSTSQIEYAATDAYKTCELAKILARYIKSDNLIEVFKLEIRALFAFAAMEYNGSNLDLERLEQVRPIYEKKVQDAKSSFLSVVPSRWIRHNFLGEVIDEGIEVTSATQVLKVLRALNIPNPLYDLKANDEALHDKIITSTGSNVIKLLDVADYPVLTELINHRKASKLLSAYVYSLPKLVNSVTGRIHPHYNQCVSTGRCSSSNPNLQNLPRPDKKEPMSIRSCFVAEPGCKLVDCDYSQIELRVVAEIIFQLTGDSRMLDEFLAKKDPYANTAALLSGMTYEQFTALDEADYKFRRQNAKAVRLGYNYAMGAKKFRNYAKITYNVSMSSKEAIQNRKVYFDAYPGLQEYHNQFLDRNLLEARTLAPFFRRRQWEEYPGIPALANHPVQGSSADIQKLAMAILYEKLYDLGYSPLQSRDIELRLTIHDEIVLHTIESLGELAKQLEQDAMIEAAKTVVKICPIEAESKLIDNLSQKG